MDSLFFEHRDYFVTRLQQLNPKSIQGPRREEPSKSPRDSSDTTVCIRVRPLSGQEIDENHIQGVTRPRGGVLSIYEPRKKVKGKPELNATSFAVDGVYLPEDSTQTLFNDQVKLLVQWVWQGGLSILLAYGQTGSGKTYTVSALERLIAEALLGGKFEGKRKVYVSIVEVFGDNLYDLLDDRKQINVVEDLFGSMQMIGALERSSANTADLLSYIDAAKALRSTAATAINDQSSRSHSLCRLRIVDADSKGASEGIFFLVDLAGSEASADNRYHPAELTAESREKDKSLSALKDCIRARALCSNSRGGLIRKHVHIPFRNSKLTKILKSAFDVSSSQRCKTLVIACISPSMLDIMHSKNTLRYAEMIRVPIPNAKPRPYDQNIPTTWSNGDVQEWIKKMCGTPIVNPVLLAPHEDGTQFCRLQQEDFSSRAYLTRGVSQEQAKALYSKLWTLHIDSRASLRKSSRRSGEGAPKPLILVCGGGVCFVSPVKGKHGMFFRLSGKCAEDGCEVVMAMGPEMSVKEGDKTVVCAALRQSDSSSDCYELLVAQQKTVKETELCDAVVMEYDSASRYYHLTN